MESVLKDEGSESLDVVVGGRAFMFAQDSRALILKNM